MNAGQLAWLDLQVRFLPLPLFFALESFQICSAVSSGRILFLNAGEIRPDVGVTTRGVIFAANRALLPAVDFQPSMLGFAPSSL